MMSVVETVEVESVGRTRVLDWGRFEQALI